MKRTLILSAASAMVMSGAAALAQDSDTSIRREHGVGREDPDYLAEGSVAPTTEEAIDVLDTEDYGDAEDYGDMDGVQDARDGSPVKPQTAAYQPVEVMEWDEMFESRIHQAFHAIDANGDRMISRREWGNWQADDGFYATRFGEFDSDDDGAVAWTEYWTATSALYDVSGLTTSSPAG